MISVENLKVKYRNITAVDDISFNVDKHEIFGVIGPNGAGKTTTVECIEGLRTPTSGKIRVMGIDPKNRTELYRHIGVQLQESSFPDEIKVVELCRLFESFYDKPADYRELLDRFSIRGKEKAFYKRLSGGEKQKVSIVLALIADPEVVFLDELTTGLDPKSRIVMWEVIKSLRDRHKTVFMTTHFMEEAEYLCDRVCLVVNGRISAMGTVPELVKKADIGQRITFVAENARAENVERIIPGTFVEEKDGAITVRGGSKNLLKDLVLALSQNNIGFDNLDYTRPGLEEVFLKLTGSELGG